MTGPATGNIGPYRIVRTVGSGGWSTVYEVVAPDGTRLALKRLAADLAPPALARFRREVESLRRIDHPGVLRLVDAGVDGAAPYLVTPLVQGTSVRALLARGPVGVEGALALVLGSADAVAAIHAAGLVHRDLKPENLMLTAAGDVIAIDLGLALGPEHSRHTAEDTVTGSVPYMSPEQIDDRAPSAASDVWALGVILYEAIAGRRPFERARQSEEVAAILAGRFTPIGELAPACPEELARLISACLSASPAQRPRDGAALASALLRSVDWVPPARLADERALLLFDPARHAASIRDARVELAVRDASRALTAGDTFAASRAIDRGLHYAPDAPALLALIDRLMSIPGGNGARPSSPDRDAGPGLRATVRGHAPPPMPAARPSVAGHPAPERAAHARSSEAAPAYPERAALPRVEGPGAHGRSTRREDAARSGPSGRRAIWIGGAVLAIGAAILAGLLTSGGDRRRTGPQTAAGDRPPSSDEPIRDPLAPPSYESTVEPKPTVSKPAHVRPSKPAHVRPARPAPGRSPVPAVDQPTSAPPPAGSP